MAHSPLSRLTKKKKVRDRTTETKKRVAQSREREGGTSFNQESNKGDLCQFVKQRQFRGERRNGLIHGQSFSSAIEKKS